MSITETSPLASGSYEPVAWNFKLLAQHELQGFGGMGEGMSMQIAPDGRRILWLAHESAPKNFTAVDVSDPRKPKVVVQTDLPQAYMRSNSLEITDNIMAVAYQTQKVGLKPAGFELFDISVPEKPKSISFFDCSSHIRAACTALVLRRRIRAHVGRRADFTPTHPNDDQFYRIIDVRNPSKPTEVGRWWLPGTRAGDGEPPPARHPKPLLDRGNPRYAQHQCVSAAARPLLSRLYRRRHVHYGYLRQVEAQADLPLGQLAALYGLHPHGAAAVRTPTSWS